MVRQTCKTHARAFSHTENDPVGSWPLHRIGLTCRIAYDVVYHIMEVVDMTCLDCLPKRRKIKKNIDTAKVLGTISACSWWLLPPCDAYQTTLWIDRNPGTDKAVPADLEIRFQVSVVYVCDQLEDSEAAVPRNDAIVNACGSSTCSTTARSDARIGQARVVSRHMRRPILDQLA